MQLSHIQTGNQEGLSGQLPFQSQMIGLDKTRLFIRNGIEVHVSPSEYALCKLLFVAHPMVPYIGIDTLELCFLFFTVPKILEAMKKPQRVSFERQPFPIIEREYLTTEQEIEHEVKLYQLDLQLLNVIAQLQHKKLTSERPLPLLPCILKKYELDANHARFTEPEQFWLRSILYVKKEKQRDLRKSISKHFSGANAKFREQGIGIQILSVGQSEGYMPVFLPSEASSKHTHSLPVPR